MRRRVLVDAERGAFVQAAPRQAVEGDRIHLSGPAGADTGVCDADDRECSCDAFVMQFKYEAHFAPVLVK